jgi:hypothetical protein
MYALISFKVELISFAPGIRVFARVGELVQRTEAAVLGICRRPTETATHLRAALHAELKQADTKRDDQNGKDRVQYHFCSTYGFSKTLRISPPSSWEWSSNTQNTKGNFTLCDRVSGAFRDTADGWRLHRRRNSRQRFPAMAGHQLGESLLVSVFDPLEHLQIGIRRDHAAVTPAR